MCTSGIVGSKNVPTCVRGYAVGRLGSFYTFHFTLCAVSDDFWSTMLVWGQSGDEFGVSFGQVWVQFSTNLGSICDQFFFGPKNVPACVRGCANRRPGIFYTFYAPWGPQC